jgi:hypothetical protein
MAMADALMSLASAGLFAAKWTRTIEQDLLLTTLLPQTAPSLAPSPAARVPAAAKLVRRTQAWLMSQLAS